MRITDVDTVAYALPFREPYVTAGGTLEQREMILVRVRTDEGLEGLGDVVPLSLRGDSTLQKAWRQMQRARHRLVGTELAGLASEQPLAGAIDVVVAQLPGRRYTPAVKAGIEMALFDLAGKVAGRPLWALLRAERADPVRSNATLAAGPPGAVAAAAGAWAQQGFADFKLKLGVGDDLAQVRAVREELGPAARIRVDANASWRLAEALDVLAALEPLDVELAEQPVAGLRAMARVAAATSIPIAADESVRSAKEATRARESGACRFATAKLAKVGGMGPAAAIAEEIPTYLSSALDGPAGIAAAGHLAQALGRRGADAGIAHGLATQRLFAATIAARECELSDGHLHLPDGPGLGIEIDAESLEARRL